MSNQIFIHEYKTEYGDLILGDFHGELCICDWKYRKMRDAVDERIKNGLEADYVTKSTSFHHLIIDQLEKYFAGELTEFDIPLKLVGTQFQQSVWQTLQEIPFGTSETYLGLSQKLGNEKAIRAVASANGANAISIIIPCHRIIGSNGELTGYAGGLATKKKLLNLERHVIGTGQMDLFMD
ncbi:MAG: methylated-DNA--[protein]-cysteine S-methyltransferase [bacterium]|nr:methylated-DNA--[protein]-cysteine S-methyltransferase [bacterium]